MAKKIPTLTTTGFVESMADKCDKAMQYFCLSNRSQSTLYPNLKPLPWLVATFGNDESAIRTQTKSALEEYLGRLFDACTVSCVSETDGEGRINLQLGIMVRDDGVEQSLAYVIVTNKAEILSIFDTNNDGYIADNRRIT